MPNDAYATALDVLRRGGHVAVVGPVNSGRSTVAEALRRDVPAASVVDDIYRSSVPAAWVALVTVSHSLGRRDPAPAVDRCVAGGLMPIPDFVLHAVGVVPAARSAAQSQPAT